MKAIFISYNQAYNEEIAELLAECGQRGFTRWEDIGGVGSNDGEPHFGNHAWPTMNHAILTVVEDSRVEPVMNALKAKDENARDLGLRAFVWKVESIY